jgi:hypothetical protein
VLGGAAVVVGVTAFAVASVASFGTLDVAAGLVVGLDATATAFSAGATAVDCSDGWSISCGLDAAGTLLGGSGLWGDWGYAPDWWGLSFGGTASVGGGTALYGSNSGKFGGDDRSRSAVGTRNSVSGRRGGPSSAGTHQCP